MIGVLSRDREKAAVAEFFELFKTPWEYYEPGRSYDVVISTGEPAPGLEARVLFVVSAEKLDFDETHGLEGRALDEGLELEYRDRRFPVYGGAREFGSRTDAVLRLDRSGEAVGVPLREGESTLYRIGIDLFGEVAHMLSTGQPAEYARTPTLEIYRTMLRDLVLRAGVPVVEIPPVPGGYRFAVCLSHDVDFVWIRRHLLDHTLLGFFYRALIGTALDFLRGKVPFRKVLRNWCAALKTPLVFLGLARDDWQQFERYVRLEESRGSTFYLIPRKGDPGKANRGTDPANSRRATRYDITDIESLVQPLLARGCEIGVHGIDAWHDPELGRSELERVQRVTGVQDMGIRMHWLFQDAETARVLEAAGFDYDSTVGYNEAVGYRAGTTQVYRPPGVGTLLELPMHIQDTALFYPRKMGLGEPEARAEVSRVLDNAEEYGGVVTLNWHHRSIAAERLWDDFYVALLQDVQRRGAWIGPARNLVQWFRKRRSVRFERLRRSGDRLDLCLRSEGSSEVPDLCLRIHRPRLERMEDGEASGDYRDIPFSERLEEEISLASGVPS